MSAAMVKYPHMSPSFRRGVLDFCHFDGTLHLGNKFVAGPITLPVLTNLQKFPGIASNIGSCYFCHIILFFGKCKKAIVLINKDDTMIPDPLLFGFIILSPFFHQGTVCEIQQHPPFHVHQRRFLFVTSGLQNHDDAAIYELSQLMWSLDILAPELNSVAMIYSPIYKM